jgi:S-DNA-T family DNA segregation ATPase FtsK/SpoIIIE
MLRTLAVAAGFTVRGGPCHVYGLDFGSRGLAMLEVLPHVGSIIGGGEDERVGRLISWLREVIDERAVRYSAANAGTITDYRRLAGAPDEPRILLLVDGLAAFRQAYESAAKSRWFDLFAGIVADGRPVGVHVVLGSEQRTGLPPSIASSVQRRVVLRMASADDYGMLDSPADVLDAASPPGRGLVDGSESQVAVLGGTSDVLAQAGAIKGFAEAMHRAGAPQAPPIRSLQDSVQLTDLPAQVDGSPVIGLSGASLDPITMPVRGSFLVAGVAGSGRTTALHTIVAALRRSDPSVRLHYFGPRRSSLAGLRVWDTCATSMLEISDKAAALAAALEAGSGGAGKVAVIIENIGEFVDGLADPALTDLGKVCLAEDHLFVVDGDTSALNSSYGLLGYAKASRSGICLQPQDGDGSLLFRNDFPRITRADMPPGRGFVVRLGRPELAQIALPPAELP